MSCLQNLGSVINTAFSVQGDKLLLDYVERAGFGPEALCEHYATDVVVPGAIPAKMAGRSATSSSATARCR